MDNHKINPKEKPKIAPGYNNDQLGENASGEFDQSYDNKSNQGSDKNKNKKEH